MRLTIENDDDSSWRWYLGWSGLVDSDFVEAHSLAEAIDASLAGIEHHLGITANEILVDGTHIVARYHRGTHEWRVGRNWHGNSASLGSALVDALRFTGMPIPSSIELTIDLAVYRKPEHK